MIKGSIFALFVASACMFSCKKDIAGERTTPTIVSDTFPERIGSPFGVMVQDLADSLRIKVAKRLAANTIRSEVALETYTGNVPYMDSIEANNFVPFTNINYFAHTGKPTPFCDNLPKMQTGITNFLNTYHPTIVAVENEEINENDFAGSALDYTKELDAATQTLHTHGIKVTNGGLTEEVLCILVWKDYTSRGLTAEAADFAHRTMPPNIYNDLPALTNYPRLQNRVLFADTLINAYKTLSFDYVNFHWYEPVIERWNDEPASAADTVNINTKAISEVAAYLKTATGKQAITNEIGQLYNSPSIVKSVMAEVKKAAIPFVIWYSGDGSKSGDRAVALNNADGTIRSSGKTYLSFLKDNY